ncbi:LCP family protein [Actinomadura verrucosospora]|uniref:Cell envelope-related transcriptional attenuator n=1 Tax=Actinomadura verrucosospora TaxID=46165 RepID=A0A7D3ZLH1_ACTVE|nr:LCP family protein [Actinomadura verrucosospora]QKG23061.1 cell envelope-related transcriptional attenuator [Actinomadura verrucosospora]
MKKRPAWAAIAVAGLLVMGSLSAYGYYWKLQSAVHREDVDKLLGKNRPKKLNDAQNIVVLGSDTRAGANARYGRGLEGKPPASDTMLMLHLSPGGGQAMGVSFPRDLMVPIPPCTRTDGSKSPGKPVAMLNEAMALAGPTCTVKTIEQFTHIHIDHFVQVDFVGFKSITTELGGVPVCVTGDVYDKDSGLRLAKGRHVLKGEQALAYVRSRHGFGDGSDTQRIRRQQHFFGAMAKQAMSGGVLADPGRLNGLLTATAKSLTTDKQLTVARMLDLAQGMRDLSAGKLRFMTVPSGPYALNKNRVQLVQPAANAFFAALRDDRTVPEPAKAPKAPPGTVRIYNASGLDGGARQVAGELRERGWKIAGVGNIGRRSAATFVRYGAGARPQADALAALVSAGRAAPRAKEAPGVVDLVIGTRFAGLKGTSIPPQQGESRASDAVCEKVT